MVTLAAPRLIVKNYFYYLIIAQKLNKIVNSKVMQIFIILANIKYFIIFTIYYKENQNGLQIIQKVI